jgi:hypothetical protein
MGRISAGVTLALLLVACGGSGSSPSTRSSSTTTASAGAPPVGHLSLTPTAPTPSSRVTFSFEAPAGSGHQGASLLSFVLSVAGPRRSGCLGSRTAVVAHVLKGMTARVRLPGTWCVGSYRAVVQEFARAYCTPGQMCPQFVRLVATVARTTFRVAPG